MNSIQSIDPKHQFIQGYFGKVWRGGHYIKDMKYMNRDLKKIIVVDRNIENVKNQPENVILLP
jgi:mitochondrial import inner membrane translocase subunit TIM50